MGRPTAYSQSTNSQTYTMGASYNKAGMVTSETYPSNKVVNTEYDSAGRIAGIKDPAKPGYYAGAASADAANRIQYTAHGTVSALKLGNNLGDSLLCPLSLQRCDAPCSGCSQRGSFNGRLR